MILSVVQSTSVAMNCSYGLAMASTMSSAKIRPRIQLKKNSLFSVLFIKCSDNNGKGGGQSMTFPFLFVNLRKVSAAKKKWGDSPSHTPTPPMVRVSVVYTPYALKYSRGSSLDSSTDRRAKIMHETYYGAKSCYTIHATAEISDKSIGKDP